MGLVRTTLTEEVANRDESDSEPIEPGTIYPYPAREAASCLKLAGIYKSPAHERHFSLQSLQRLREPGSSKKEDALLPYQIMGHLDTSTRGKAL